MTSTAVETADPVARLNERNDRLDQPISGDPKSQALALREQVDYARTLAQADILPKSFAAKPGNVLWALAYARALDLEAPVVMQNLHVIDGKAGMSADLVASLVRRAGHTLRVGGGTDADGPTGWAEITRKDDPGFTYRVEWNMAKAATAGLATKSNWKGYGGPLCKRRSTVECARDACPEVMLGIATVDELEETHDAEVPPVQVTQGQAPSSIVAAAEAVRTAAPVEPEVGADGHPIEDAEVVEDLPANPPEDMITDGQQKRIAVLMRDCEITSRTMALQYVRDVVGRDLESRKELTRVEATQVVDALEKDRAELRGGQPDTGGPDAAEQQSILNAERDEAGQL